MFLSYTGICVWYMCKLPTLFLNVSTCCDLDKNDMKCSCFVLMFISPFICMLSPGALQIPKSIVAYLQVCIHEQHTGGFDGRWADFICLQDEPYGYVHLGIPGIIKCQPFKWDPSSFFFLGGGAISSCSDVCQVPSLKLKASLHLKIDGWNTRPSFLGVWSLFSGWSVIVSGSECISGACMGMLESMEKNWGISLNNQYCMKFGLVSYTDPCTCTIRIIRSKKSPKIHHEQVSLTRTMLWI